MRTAILVTVVLAMAVSACGDVADEASATTATVEESAPPPDSSPSESDSSGDDSTEPPPTTLPEEGTVEEEELPERVPPPSETPVTGEADPTLVASIKQDLIDRTGAAESDINVVRSEEVIWNDGSLGCPVPGEMYTQALVNGFWVVLEYGGTEYDYRANDRGFFRLCEGLGAPPSNPTG